MITAQIVSRRSALAGTVAAAAAATVTPLTTTAIAEVATSQASGVTYVIRFNVRPGKRDLFLTLLSNLLDQMQHETTFRQAVLHRDPTSDHSFMLYETWQSHEDVLNVQLKRPYRDAWHAALPELLQAERDISIWEPISALGTAPSSR